MNAAPKPTGTTNELAKERNRAAAERTLTSWIQNSITLIGFGVAFDQVIAALQQTFPQPNWTMIVTLGQILGLSLIVLGISLLILAMVQNHISVQSIERDDYILMPSRSLNLTVGSAILLFGLATLIKILL
jgi:putative membrane protein